MTAKEERRAVLREVRQALGGDSGKDTAARIADVVLALSAKLGMDWPDVLMHYVYDIISAMKNEYGD